MHLASEVTSTTTNSSVDKPSNGTSANNNNNSSSNNNNSNTPLTAENLAERTIDSLLAEHPGELVKTGCPHVVSVDFPLLFLVLVRNFLVLFFAFIFENCLGGLFSDFFHILLSLHLPIVLAICKGSIEF